MPGAGRTFLGRIRLTISGQPSLILFTQCHAMYPHSRNISFRLAKSWAENKKDRLHAVSISSGFQAGSSGFMLSVICATVLKSICCLCSLGTLSCLVAWILSTRRQRRYFMCTHSWYSFISITWSRIWNMGYDEIRVTHMKCRRHVSLNKCAQMSKKCQRQPVQMIMSMKLHCEAYYKYLIVCTFHMLPFTSFSSFGCCRLF